MSTITKHVLFIQPSLEGVGGIEKVVPTVASELSKRGHKVSATVFYNSIPEQQTFWLKRFAYTEIATKNIFHRLMKVRRRISFIQECIRLAKPDVLIVSAQGTTIITLLGRFFRIYSAPVVVYVHEGVDVSGGMYRLLMKWLYRYAARFIFVSSGLQDEFIECLKVDSSKCVVAYNSIQIPTEVSGTTFDFSKYPKPYFVTASRIELIKGVDVLVEQFIQYAQDHPGTLFILGTGSLEHKLKRSVEKAGVTDRIIWLGWRDDVLSFVHKCDSYLSFARSEAFGISIIESLAVGVPVVATDVPYGPREILEGNAQVNITSYPHMTDYGVLCSPDFAKQSPELNQKEFSIALDITIADAGTFLPSKLRDRAADFSVAKQVEVFETLIRTIQKNYA